MLTMTLNAYIITSNHYLYTPLGRIFMYILRPYLLMYFIYKVLKICNVNICGVNVLLSAYSM